MTAEALIDSLRRRGVQLWSAEGKLHFKAPKGVLTAANRASLADNKDAIMEALARESMEFSALVVDPNSWWDPFPLTDVQAAYLLGRQAIYAYGGVGCTVYTETAFPCLAPDNVQAAWNTLVVRHGMLRTVFDNRGFQQIQKSVPQYLVNIHDLTDMDSSGVEHSRQKVRERMDHRIFSPDRWPLFALEVSKDAKSTVLHLSVDFLIADYLSINLLLEEFVALCQGDPIGSPPELSFRDYVLAENKERDTLIYQRDREYWSGRLGTLAAAPDLPVRDTYSERFVRYSSVVSPDEWDTLRTAAQQRKITPSVAILAAYSEVLACWSTSTDFSLNLTLLNRRPYHADVDKLVGDFTSITLLEVHHDGSTTFSVRTRELQTRLWQDLEHRLYSGVEVLRELGRLRGAEAALMPVIFTSTIGLADTGTKSRLGALGGELVHSISQTPQVWIDCQAVEDHRGLTLSWDVRDGVLEPGVAAAMYGAFVDLVRRLNRDGTWIDKHPVALPDDQQARRQQCNDTSGTLPRRTLFADFLERVHEDPTRTAVIAVDGSLTYGELLARAQCLATELSQLDLGIGPVAITLDKGLDQVVAVFGVLLSGRAYLPVDTTQPPLRRSRILLDAGAVALVGHSHQVDRESVPEGLAFLCMDHEMVTDPKSTTSLPGSQSSPDDLAYVIYTSGSTGQPKGVMMSHRAALNTIDDVIERFGVTAEDRVFGLAQLGFDLSVFDLFGTLGLGGVLVLPDPSLRSDPRHWAKLLDEHRITLWNSVPAQLQMLCDHLESSRVGSPPPLRMAWLSGDWVPVALPAKARAQIPGLRLISLGGATEAGIWSIFYEIGEVASDWSSIPYGRPLANQVFRVLGPTFEDRPEWVAGELFIGGDSLALGYVGDPALTSQRFIIDEASGSRLYRTGDLGRYRSDGEIEFLGRVDHQVKVRGHRIELSEIESALESFPDVSRAAVVAPGPATERRLAGFVEPRVSSSEPTGHKDLHMSAERAGREAEGARPQDFVQFSDALEVTGQEIMLATLRDAGVFVSPHQQVTLEQLVTRTRVAPDYERLLRRWVRKLHQDGILGEAHGAYFASGQHSDGTLDAAWGRVERLRLDFGYGDEITRRLKASSLELLSMMRGELDPLQVLFPEGRRASQEAFKDYQIGAYVSQILIASVHAALECLPAGYRARILELGSGGWGTTGELIHALDGFSVDYLYTHPAQFFLSEGRQNYAHLPWMQFASVSLDQPLVSQGIEPNSMDIVVAMNFLHSGTDSEKTLHNIWEVIAPGGWLIFFETTEDSRWIMTSLELTAGTGHYTDFRANSDLTFLSREQWCERLEALPGARLAHVAPAPDAPFSGLGQHVFACQAKTDRVRVDPGDLAEWLRCRLPEYMVPSHLTILDAIPLNSNGKVDRGALAERVHIDSVSVDPSDAPQGELEAKLAELWSEVLGIDEVSRGANFFNLGGDSLLAARLMGRLREVISGNGDHFWDTLVRQFMPDPTIKSLAAAIETSSQEQNLRQTAGRPVASTRQYGEVSNVFALEAFGHPMHELDDLYKSIGQVRGLTVIHPDPELARGEQRDLLDELVRDVVQTMSPPKDDPLRLVGLQGSGVLALEVARMLLEGGRSVSLTVVSSFPFPHPIEDELFADYLFALDSGIDPRKVGYPEEEAMGEALRAVLAEYGAVPDGAIARLGGNPALDAAARAMRRLGRRAKHFRLDALAEQTGEDRDELARRKSAHSALSKALSHHHIEPYAGDVALVYHKEESAIWPSMRSDMERFWVEQCLGEITTLESAGNHFNLTRAGNATALTELLVKSGVLR